MAIIKCKMCGGDLVLTEGATIAECEYCGTNQTVPNVQNDVIRNLFNRANNLRIKCEFDKAEQIYEKILQEDDTQAEAHWGIVLCKYGIEYVEDPATYKRIPTCHRTSFESVIAGAEYQAALLHADMTQKGLYEAEAAAIDGIQKSILDVVRNEEPFDVFLCYKQTDEYGKRTVDSAIANEIYYQLTQEGLKVFYAAITLEDKLGQAYEPYIFAALNSAKVMLVIGTRPEFFTAVWVKNEWSRFMKLMKTDRSKLLIPCYKDMDAYDLPEEFAHLQAQDMAKIGFINDVVRGIRKVLAKDSAPVAPVTAVTQTPVQASSAPLLKRAAMFLEDGQWDNAEEYSEKVLDADPECAEAYLIKLLSGNRVSTLEKLAAKRLQMTQPVSYAQLTAAVDTALRDRVMETYTVTGYYSPKEILEIYTKFDARYPSAVACRQRQRQEEAQWWEDNYFVAKVTRFADKEVAQQLRGTIDKILAEMDERTAQAEKQAELELQAVHERYAALEKTAAEVAELRKNKRESDYRKHADMHDSNSCDQLRTTIAALENMGDYKDAPALIEQYKARIQELEEREAAYNRERAAERLALAAKTRKKRRTIAVIAASVVCLVVAAIIVISTVIMPPKNYEKAQRLMLQGKTAEAAMAFGKLGDYKDARERSMQLWDQIAQRDTVFVDYETAVAIREDGTIAVAGELDGDVSSWDHCIAVYNDGSDVIALRDDGTVYNTEDSKTRKWTDIVAVSVSWHILGLKSDGTVVADGSNYHGECKVSGWDNIIDVVAGGNHSVGLRADGTVVAVGDNRCGQCNVSEWTDIVAISAGYDHTVGLKSDGTVVATKYIENYNNEDYRGQCDVYDWNNIVQISAGSYYTVGLRADGTVIATGYGADDYYDRMLVGTWEDVVAVAAGSYDTLGLYADGTIVYAGSQWQIEKAVSEWTDIRVPE